MTSQAKRYFDIAIENASLLCLNGINFAVPSRHRQVQYQAALAAAVGSWEAYLEAVSREFLAEIADPLDTRFSALQRLLQQRLEIELKRFNTPNSKNSRELIVNYTGYDPINDWSWPRRKMGGIELRNLMDEIVRVRHSFAHGFTMPAYDWNSDRLGQPRLTSRALKMVVALFSHLTSVTDKSLDRHIRTTYGRTIVWYQI